MGFGAQAQLAKVAATYSSSSKLPKCLPGIDTWGGVLVIISHRRRRPPPPEHIQGLPFTRRVSASMTWEESEGGPATPHTSTPHLIGQSLGLLRKDAPPHTHTLVQASASVHA